MPGRQVNSGDYRYGFNSQEKVDEIAGAGNHNTAEFGELDTRLGRRWNEDPKPNPSVSNYAVFGNNPIYQYDLKLDTPTVGNRISGGLKVIGGAVEAIVGGVGGVVTSETGVGAAVGYAVLVHGADNMSAGINQMVTGEETTTFTEKTLSKSLQYAGVNQGSADYYAGYGNAMLSIAGSGNLVAQADALAVKISTPKVIPDGQVLVRHHTSLEGLSGIKSTQSINASRGTPSGVDVEVAPFLNPAKVNMGQAGTGAYVEFFADKSKLLANPTIMQGAGNAARIVTEGAPLMLRNANATFVKPWIPWKTW